jgi:hypothetical protein
MSADLGSLAPLLAFRGLRLVAHLLSGADLTSAHYGLLSQLTLLCATLPHGVLLCRILDDLQHPTEVLDTEEKHATSVLLEVLLEAVAPALSAPNGWAECAPGSPEGWSRLAPAPPDTAPAPTAAAPRRCQKSTRR